MIISQICLNKLETKSLGRKWKYAFHGLSVDNRGDVSNAFLKEHAVNVYNISYNSDNFEIIIDGKSRLFEAFDFDFADVTDGILIDLTTVDLVEIIYLLKIASKAKVGVDLIYCEPNSYKKFDSKFPNIQKQYDLSTDVNDFRSVPGFSVIDDIIGEKEYVFLTGYEANRIEAAFEYKEDISGNNSHVIFGVPAYCSGWETNSLFNTIHVIDDEKIVGSINYSGATDVINTYKQLEKIIHSMPKTEASLCILPLGNKPMTLASALTLIEHQGVTSLLYDHPKQSNFRTDKIGKWHFYRICWS